MFSYYAFWRRFPLALLILMAVTGLLIGAWQVGWIFHSANVNRDAQVSQQGYANQSAMRDEINRKLDDVTRYTIQMQNPAYAAEKNGIAQSRSFAAQLVCGDAAQLNPGTQLPPDEMQWINGNCAMGSLKVTSIYSTDTQPGQ